MLKELITVLGTAILLVGTMSVLAIDFVEVGELFALALVADVLRSGQMLDRFVAGLEGRALMPQE